MIHGSHQFYPANRRVFDDPRATFVVDDAKAFFAESRRRFDVILSEPSNPWVSGVSGLFTDEFYRRVRGWLTPDGVFGQWLHLYEIDDRLVLTLPRPHGKSTLPAARGLLRSFLEAQIRRDVSRCLARYCPELDRAPVAVRLRPLKSLWGSLDTRDRVTLDLALALAPPAALRYVVVHELCHLRIRSHSSRFWVLVEKLYPEWREQRDWLRVHGQALKAELARLIQAPAT